MAETKELSLGRHFVPTGSALRSLYFLLPKQKKSSQLYFPSYLWCYEPKAFSITIRFRHRLTHFMPSVYTELETLLNEVRLASGVTASLTGIGRVEEKPFNSMMNPREVPGQDHPPTRY